MYNTIFMQSLDNLVKSDSGKHETRGVDGFNSNDDMSAENDSGGAEEEQINEFYKSTLSVFRDDPEFMEFSFSMEDIRVIAKFYSMLTEGGRNYLDFNKIIKAAKLSNQSSCEKVLYVNSLIDRGIIIFEDEADASANHQTNIEKTLNCDYMLSSPVKNRILGVDTLTIANNSFNKSISLSAPITAVSEFMGVIRSTHYELRKLIGIHAGIFYGRIIRQYLDMLVEEILRNPHTQELSNLFTKNKLSDVEIRLFILVYYYNTCKEMDLGIDNIARILASDEAEFIQIKQTITQGIAKSNPVFAINDYWGRFRNVIMFHPDFEKQLNAIETQKNDTLGSFIDHDLFEIIKTNQTMEQLILPHDEQELLKCVVARICEPGKYDLSQWGIADPTSSRNACVIMLHGAPGTGKTYAAGVIANELKRPLVQIKASTLRDSYYGVSEKRMENVFTHMKNLNEQLQTPPVFLINEADSLIHHRIHNISSSSMATENAIQNIFLEGLERFQGIMVLTTNLVEVMDEALSRRINFKIEFNIPDASSRVKLWKLHLPLSVPGSEDLDYEYLARYRLTGGQISLIVTNACDYAIAKGRITMKDLVRYIDLETGSSFERKEKTVGF